MKISRTIKSVIAILLSFGLLVGILSGCTDDDPAVSSVSSESEALPTENDVPLLTSSDETESDPVSSEESDPSESTASSSAGGGTTAGGTVIHPSGGTATQYYSPHDTYSTPNSVGVVGPANAPSYGVASQGDPYINVGNQYICEIVNWEAETFDGRTTDDANSPLYTPLPVGTVDYCSNVIITNGKSRSHSEYRDYSVLRCGKRVYHESLQCQRSRVYTTAEHGALPETNNVAIASGGKNGRYTELTLNVDWKAPFQVELTPQSYRSTNLSSRNFTVDKVTYNTVEITFSYADKPSTTDIANLNFDGTIFESAAWQKNTSDYTLRLTLKKPGGFYGWTADYNSAGQLVFRFLNPAKVSGNSLAGTTIFIDVGHGGKDSGAVGRYGGNNYNESDMNLYLAKTIKSKLTAMGATVVLSREGNEYSNAVFAMQKIINAKPDLAICIHHDSSSNASMNGCGVYHYNGLSANAAKIIQSTIKEANLYQTVNDLRWHYYFCARVNTCPVVLTENGFMSNASDLSKIVTAEFNEQRATVLANGILKYFQSIQ